MHHFRIVPTGSHGKVYEVDGQDGSVALHALSRMRYDEADIWQDGRYIFSARKQKDEGSFWTIFQRPLLRSAVGCIN